MTNVATLTGFEPRLTPLMRALVARPGIGRQFIADRRELDLGPTALVDPIGDKVHEPVTGLTHRYPDRVILRATLSCLVHCRFCFRREVLGEAGPMAKADLAAAMAYIAERPAIREVILTGGDPLSLSERRLDRAYGSVRGDTAFGNPTHPFADPRRRPDMITGTLAWRLGQGALSLWFVLHVNHADELIEKAAEAIARLV